MKWLIRNRLNAFQKTWGYDTSYMREMLDIDPGAVMAFYKIQAMGNYRKDVPKDVYTAAALVSSMAEDCGPCTQLGVTMALEGGVAPETIAAVVRGDLDAMPEAVRLAVKFARAVIAHAPEADEYREEIEKRWGKRAVVSLAFGITVARVYPTVKYAIGHGKACQRIVVAGTAVPVLREVA